MEHIDTVVEAVRLPRGARSRRDDDLVGSTVGAIKIVGRLGSGGSGTVYEGFDETLGRRVAVKALHAVVIDQGGRARLLREARILSRLDDPRVCRLYEYRSAGQRDVLVMELVEGDTLAAILRGEPARLTRRRRVAIAEAVAAVLVRAHAEGVVHRDLKPSNVMLTPADEVKVLDFGIASLGERAEPAPVAAGDEAAADRELHTRAGVILGTVAYMSPEQANGETATPASDMYSFGLFLQELFSGRRPHPDGLTGEALLLRAASGESEPTSGLGAELSRLVERLKSLEPERRPTAEQALTVLRRLAAAPRRRLRWLLAGTALALVVAALAKHQLDLERERNLAVAEREQAVLARREAEEVVRFLTTLFRVADPGEARGRTVTADELLARGAERVERDLVGQPMVRARLMRTIGTVYRNLGLFDEAERFIGGALAVLRAEVGEDHLEVAETLESLAILYDTRRRSDEAEQLLRQVLAVRERALGADHPLVAQTLSNLGESLRHRGDTSGAEPLFRRAVAIHERSPEQRDGLAIALNNLAGVCWSEGRHEEAADALARVLEIERATYPAEHPRIARTLNNLGLLRLAAGQFDEAEELFRQSLAIKRTVLGDRHPELASTLYNLGEACWRAGRLDEAEALLRQSLALDEANLGHDHPDVAGSYALLGRVLRDAGRRAEAVATLRHALDVYERSAPEDAERAEVESDLAGLTDGVPPAAQTDSPAQ